MKEAYRGMGEAVVNTVKGVIQTVLHPVETVQSIVYAAAHPVETFNAIKNYYDVSSPRGIGHIAGDVAITVVTVAVAAEIKAATAPSEYSAVTAAARTEAAVATSERSLVPWIDPAGYAPNGGVLGAEEITTLNPGTILSRIGDTQGYYVSPVDTPFEMRSLPASRIGEPLTNYQVVKPLEVTKSTVAPWYGQFGYGTQYRLFKTIEDALREKYIVPHP